MATLEKIRSKSGLLFTLIIIALLAFIMGDFFDSSRSLFGPGTAAAKVDGHKIDYQQYNSRVEQMRQQMQDRGYTNTDLAVIQQEVLNQMVYEELIKEEYDRLGIVVTDNELSQAMLGTTALPGLVRQIQQQFGIASPDQLYDMAFNPQKYQIPAEYASQLQDAWKQLEESVEKSLLQSKLGNLFVASLTANKLDAKDLYEQNAITSTVNFAKVDYSTLNDEDFAPTDAEINEKYSELKSRFKLTEPVRKVQYITVDIRPSQEDLVKAQQDVEAAIDLLNKQEGVDGLSGLFVANTVTNKKAGLSSKIAAAADTLEVGQAKLIGFSNNTYTIAKLLARKEGQLDSVRYEVGVVPVASPEQRDSLLAALNSGASLEELSAGQYQPSTAVSLISADAAPLRQLIEGQPTGRYFTPDTAATAQQMRVIRINGYSPAVTTYEVAEITYQVDPSSTTVNTLRQGLSDFIAKNSTADKFTEEASKEGFHIFPAEVTASAFSLANLPETRTAVKWTNKAKKGQVSGIFGDEQDGRFIAVALTDIYDKYIPAKESGVNTYLRQLVINDKKAKKLIADYSGKGTDVASYAKAMNVEADTAEVTFGQPIISGFPFGENDFSAQVAAAEKGKLVGPVQSNSAVIVFNVLDSKAEGRQFDFNTDAATFSQTQGAPVLSRNLFNILLGKNKIENNVLNFYRDEED